VDWSEVQSVIVDLAYEDKASDYRQQRTLSLSETSLGSLQQPLWKFPLRNPDVRGYRYSVKTLGKDGTVRMADWTDMPDDSGTLIIGEALGGVVKLQVDPGDTGVGSTLRRVVVRLRYADPARNVLDQQSLVFRDPTPQIWSIARADATVAAYTYDVEYVAADGTVTSLTGQQGRIAGSSDFLFLPAPPVRQPQPTGPNA
jgi:hypothetical protein